MASFFELEDEDIYISTLETVGRNWSTWCESVKSVIKRAGLQSYLDGTVSEPNRQLEATAKFILITGIPDLILGSLPHLTTAHDYYKHLTNRFDESTVQLLQEQLPKCEGCCDAEPQVAARTRKTFGGACRKCSKHGHKACECRAVGIKSQAAKAEEKLTRSCQKARRGMESPS